MSNDAKPTSGLAIAALVVSIIGFCMPILFPISLLLGILALRDIKKNEKGGQVLAIISIVISCLLVLITVIYLAIAIPGFMRARIAANEGSAMGTLRSVATAEVQFQQQGLVNQDADGIGEYGFLGELSGAYPGRGDDPRTADPSFITAALTPGPDGIAKKGGYCYAVYLPGNADFSTAMDEQNRETTDDPETINMQENAFIFYAWPISPSDGERVFAINQAGEVMSADNNEEYSENNPPAFDAALNAEGKIDGLGKDGKTWTSLYY